MGSPKALLPWRGRPAALHLAAQLRTCERQILVVRAGCDWLTDELRSAFELAVNPAPERGMLSSVQAGLELAGSGVAVLLTPVDCFGFDETTVDALRAAHRETGRSVVPTVGGRGGHPVLLAPDAVAAVLAADPERTRLDHLLGELSPPPLCVEVDDRGVLDNFNRPEDLRQ